jgi:hypothetical protein
MLTLLLDPRGGVHATTGIVPVTRVDLPPEFVAGPLKAMEVTFRLAPALTFAQPTPVVAGQTPAYPNAVVLPQPSEQNGTWSFWDQEPVWTGYDIVPATPNALFKPYRITLRDGRLQFVADLGDDSKP